MSSTFSSSFFGPGGLRFGLAPSSGHCEDHGAAQPSDPVSGPVPFLLYPPPVDRANLGGFYKGPLLPYLPPFHHHGHFSVYECPFEPAFIQKRNERERQRVKCVNQGYAKLRDHLPGHSADKRLSKVETLRAAIRYIKYLQGLVEPEDGSGGGQRPGSTSPGPDSEGFTC
ncbi:achaete-scute homolog 5-like [Sphaeramia orbicularis]|nr:achaete-scute homolog 5-like [Sphaeramia orbicularis]XP_029989512.1 achaete-scute homolog 5-like [Sphaeramia orbicularis]